MQLGDLLPDMANSSDTADQGEVILEPSGEGGGFRLLPTVGWAVG